MCDHALRVVQLKMAGPPFLLIDGQRLRHDLSPRRARGALGRASYRVAGALGYEPGGREFESLRAHHSFP